MRTASIFFSAIILLLLPLSNQSQAELNVGVSIDDDGVKGFYLAVGEHFNAPEKEIVIVRQKNVPDEELPVVYFLARRADVGPDVIIKLRIGGKSWMDIAAHYGLSAEIFYVPVKRTPDPPYGKAYGHYKNRKKAEWNTIVLTNLEIVNFVNLKFLSEHYGYSPDDIISMREKGKSFVAINGEVKKDKGQMKKQSKQLAAEEKSGKKSKGKGKNK